MADNGNRRPNDLLRRQRRLRGWTLDDVAERLHQMVAAAGDAELGVDAHMVGRWERGVRHPAPRYVALLCRLFEQSADQLGLVPAEQTVDRAVDLGSALGPSTGGREDDVQRRQFLQYVGVLGGASMLDWDRLGTLLRGQADAADEPLLDDLEALTRSYGRQVESRAPMILLPTLREHLRGLTSSLQASPPAALRRRLLSLTGMTAVMTGRLSYLLENRGDARTSWAFALELAREAGDDDLFAVTLAHQRLFHSTIPSRGRFGNTTRALSLLNEAESKLSNASSPHVQVMVLAKRAEEHAADGNHSATERDLERAERLLDAAPRDDGFFADWDRAFLAGYRGSCLIALERPQDATEALEKARQLTRPSLVGQRCAVTTDLAAAYAQQREVDRACELLAESLETAERAGLEELVSRVNGARRHLDPWPDALPVRHLDERLTAHV